MGRRAQRMRPSPTDTDARRLMTRKEHPRKEKLYLDVPFPDKDQAKARGGRWDRDGNAARTPWL